MYNYKNIYNIDEEFQVYSNSTTLSGVATIRHHTMLLKNHYIPYILTVIPMTRPFRNRKAVSPTLPLHPFCPSPHPLPLRPPANLPSFTPLPFFIADCLSCL